MPRLLFAAAACAATLIGCAKSPPTAPPSTTATPPAGGGQKVLVLGGDGKLTEQRMDLKPGPVGPKPTVVGEFPRQVHAIVASGGPGGVYAAVMSAEGGSGDRVTVCKTATNARLGAIGVKGVTRFFAPSPDGKLLVAVPTGDAQELPVYSVADGKETGKIKLKGEGESRPRPALVAVEFAATGQLLVMRDNGGFEAYDPADGKRLYGVGGGQKSPEQFSPHRRKGWFGLAESAPVLAAFAGDHFAFYDPATGKVTGKTEPLGVTAPFEVWGCAVSPDGGRLAVAVRKGNKEKGTDHLDLFDRATGKRLSATDLTKKLHDPFATRLDWLNPGATGGPGTLALGGNTGHDVQLWAATDTPTELTTLATHTIPTTCGGMLWRSIQPKGDPKAPYALVGIAPPPAGAGKTLWFYRDGYTTGPKFEN